MNTEQKLNILADSSKFDLACACKPKSEPGRSRGPQGRWIYPAVLPNGGKVFLLKTLQTNACGGDCSYCPFNSRQDLPRCTLSPEQLADMFIQLRNARQVSGLFLSSGVTGTADQTMERMISTVELLRGRYRFKGFIHLKIIPGASANAIEQAVRLATRVSVNIEAPTAERLGKLTRKKDFHHDIIDIMNRINTISANLNKRPNQTTQFVVGAAGETDREIVQRTHDLYRKMKLHRVYFSAYQNFNNAAAVIQPTLFPDIEPEVAPSAQESFIREHRLYQVDFLFRKYRFEADEIDYDSNGNLSLSCDPKTLWARHHPEFFPIDPNTADRWQLLRVPGIGPILADRIIDARKQRKIRSMNDLESIHKRMRIAKDYLSFPKYSS